MLKKRRSASFTVPNVKKLRQNPHNVKCAAALLLNVHLLCWRETVASRANTPKPGKITNGDFGTKYAPSTRKRSDSEIPYDQYTVAPARKHATPSIKIPAIM